MYQQTDGITLDSLLGAVLEIIFIDCISHSTNTLGKGMNPNILPPAMGK